MLICVCVCVCSFSEVLWWRWRQAAPVAWGGEGGGSNQIRVWGLWIKAWAAALSTLILFLHPLLSPSEPPPPICRFPDANTPPGVISIIALWTCSNSSTLSLTRAHTHTQARDGVCYIKLLLYLEGKVTVSVFPVGFKSFSSSDI